VPGVAPIYRDEELGGFWRAGKTERPQACHPRLLIEGWQPMLIGVDRGARRSVAEFEALLGCVSRLRIEEASDLEPHQRTMYARCRARKPGGRFVVKSNINWKLCSFGLLVRMPYDTMDAETV
jgi:hypothetical protein